MDDRYENNPIEILRVDWSVSPSGKEGISES